jgi:flagellar protein FliS
MANPYAQQYTQVQTTTVGPEQVLLLLYEGAVRFLGQAREHLDAGRTGPGKTALSKAVAIVAELQNSLDPEAGWDGAEDLGHLYGHMILELTQANLRGELDRIDAVRDLLSGLYGAWREAIVSLPAAPAPAPGTGNPPAQGEAAGGGGGMPSERPPFRASI